MRGVLSFNEFGLLREKSDDIQTLVNLLAVADRPGTPGEGEAALHQATRLAAKLGMSLDDARKITRSSGTGRAKGVVDPSDKMFIEIKLIADHIPGIKFHDRTTNTPFAKESAVWHLYHEGVAIEIHVPMTGPKDHHIMWYLVHRDKNKYRIDADDTIAKSTNAQDLLNALRTVDWKGLKLKAEAEEEQKKVQAYNTAQQMTPEMQAVVDLAIKHGYELEPGHVGMSWRQLRSEPFQLTVMQDGSWYHETRQGDIHTKKWKADTRRWDKKNIGPDKLDTWLKTKRSSGEKPFSVHEEINKIVKVLSHFGFKPEEKTGNQHTWINPVAGYKVQFGPNKFRGALNKNDSVFWMIRAIMVRNAANNGYQYQHDLKAQVGEDNTHGTDAVKLQHVLEKIVTKAEVGFDKVVAVLTKYGFYPDAKAVERPTHNMEYFNTKGGKYYAAVGPKTGEWILYMRMSFGHDMMDKQGTTADELEMILKRLKALPHDPINTGGKKANG